MLPNPGNILVNLLCTSSFFSHRISIMDAFEGITSEESNITLIFEKFFIQFYKDYLAQQKQAAALNKTLQKENFEFAYLYILVIFGIFTVLIISMLASTVRSRRQEHRDDPYHTYIANDSRKSKMEKDFPKIYINENVARALQNMSEGDTVTFQYR
ncbi:potassium voltage-gated channel subfamily E member 2-like [Hemitrygon akajei]|uniref:potassium voltage-gated channel subfamily E member 2-like n=1 Tax=Hemitrygon akajei TaxID=2704970 RepID=UPI003BF9646B